jgi:hypothetical protein
MQEGQEENIGGGLVLRLRKYTCRHLVSKGWPSENPKVGTSSRLWLMLQDEEGKLGHSQNGQEK